MALIQPDVIVPLLGESNARIVNNPSRDKKIPRMSNLRSKDNPLVMGFTDRAGWVVLTGNEEDLSGRRNQENIPRRADNCDLPPVF